MAVTELHCEITVKIRCKFFSPRAILRKTNLLLANYMTTELSDINDPGTLLAWHIAMGVDEAIADEPIDRFNAPAPLPAQLNVAAQKQQTTPTPITARPAQPTSGAGAEAATAIAQACHTIEELRLALKSFDGGLLKRSAKNTVFSDGVVDAPLMVIGDLPGSEEDQSGKPFVGPSGQLLDKMLSAINCSRSDNAYLTNFVPWRPLGSAKPNTEILSMCKPFVERHIALAKPKIVVLMGGIPAKTLLNTEDSISRLRGKWKKLSLEGTDFDVLPMVHPSYLISQPLQKRAAWQDLLSIREKLLS